MTTDLLAWAPPACTLPTVERPLREREFATLFASSLIAVERVSANTATFTLRLGSIDQARDLGARESSCCSFFAFDVREHAGAAEMSITVPSQHVAVLDALLGSATAGVNLERP
jgi:hypothetical protein